VVGPLWIGTDFVGQAFQLLSSLTLGDVRLESLTDSDAGLGPRGNRSRHLSSCS
jgi:hypothetical protein